MIKRANYTILALLAAICSNLLASEPIKDYPVKPVPFTKVKITDRFWAPRMETNRAVTIPYAFGKCEENGRMSNFDIAAGSATGAHRGGFPFDDTDPYKIIEGASYALLVHPDPKLEKYLDDLIAQIGAAQQEDGYLYTCRTNNAGYLDNWSGKQRWAKLAGSHELYNAGHMYEAAVAHYQATGKRSFLDIAIKNADLICRTFGPDKTRDVPGHQIIEMGLARLYRATGDVKYIEMAKFFLDERGREHGRKLYGPYTQDHLPITEQDEAVGHAVRATYMYAGIADIAALTGNTEYVKAIDNLWDNVVSKKLYLTGGVGATGHGEAFGKNYELPNMSAYCETCAAIGNVYWNHRLFLLHGHAKYFDVLERTLYNGLISGVSLDGKLFFYPNPLESQGQHQRSPWFGCACCPGNVTRFIASVPGYAYAHRDDQLYVNLYANSTATVEMNDQTVSIDQQTLYPWDGMVKLTFKPQRSANFAVNLRIPGWAQNQPVASNLYKFANPNNEPVTIEVNGKNVKPNIQKGYAVINRKWKKDDSLTINLPMPIRRVLCNEKVVANIGRVALQRGPLVYCAEWPDNNNHVLNLMLTDEAPLKTQFRKDLFDGVTVIRGKACGLTYGKDSRQINMKLKDFMAIPYYAWAHRGKGEMAVWLPRTIEAAKPLAGPTIASQSKLSTSYQTQTANAILKSVNDQQLPKNSIDHSVSFFHWWPRNNTTEWVQYDFKEPQEVSTVEVYWFDDTGRGGCRTPQSWQILYRINDKWEKVWTQQEYGTQKDKFNKVIFETVKTNALRLEVKLQKNASAGVHEWRVK